MFEISRLVQLTDSLAADKTAAIKYAEHLDELFGEIDPQAIGADYENAIAGGDITAAAKALAAHFRAKKRNTVPELSAEGECDTALADKTVTGYAREVNIDWQFEDGNLDYLFDPTALNGPRNYEWLWQFNRHTYWINLARSYVATKDEKYALAFEKQLLKWIAQTYVPENWNGPGSAWRTIECGIRLLGSWQVAYDGFVRSDSVNDITVLLMIASMLRHAVHLVAHPTAKNWLMMEMNGVYTFSALFPELKGAQERRRIAAGYIIDELTLQILPDGMHNELSPDYQSVVVRSAANFYSLAYNLNYSADVPENFAELIKQTVNAAVALSTPAFTQPRTNDCFTINTSVMTGRAEQLFGKDPAWSYVNTCRREGFISDENTSSRYLPYAGLAVMRNDWTADSAYLCFDVGPLGVAHIHQDKLNINVYKGGEELIFDDGGGQYDISRIRTHAISGYGHNTLLVDGLAQKRREPMQLDTPADATWITNADFDYASAVYDDGFGDNMAKIATHKREVRFCKPDFFIVRDTVSSADGSAHDFEILFHLDTTKVHRPANYENAVVSDYGRKYNVAIIPVDCSCASPEISIDTAVTEPMLRGWYNGRNETDLHPATTVSRKVCGVKKYCFTSLIFPIETESDLPTVTASDGVINVSFKGESYTVNTASLDKPL